MSAAIRRWRTFSRGLTRSKPRIRGYQTAYVGTAAVAGYLYEKYLYIQVAKFETRLFSEYVDVHAPRSYEWSVRIGQAVAKRKYHS